MNTISRFRRPSYEPNTDLLRIQGWSIISVFGPYCRAWKGSCEILVVWRNGAWQKVSGQGWVSPRELLAA
jgi:hypothetical protein